MTRRQLLHSSNTFTPRLFLSSTFLPPTSVTHSSFAKPSILPTLNYSYFLQHSSFLLKLYILVSLYHPHTSPPIQFSHTHSLKTFIHSLLPGPIHPMLPHQTFYVLTDYPRVGASISCHCLISGQFSNPSVFPLSRPTPFVISLARVSFGRLCILVLFLGSLCPSRHYSSVQSSSFLKSL